MSWQVHSDDCPATSPRHGTCWCSPTTGNETLAAQAYHDFRSLRPRNANDRATLMAWLKLNQDRILRARTTIANASRNASWAEHQLKEQP